MKFEFRGLLYMTYGQKGGGGRRTRNTPNLRTNSIELAEKEEGRVSKNPKIMWTSYMEAPLLETFLVLFVCIVSQVLRILYQCHFHHETAMKARPVPVSHIKSTDN